MVTGDGFLHALAVTGASLPALVLRRPSGETVPDYWHRGTCPS